MARKKRDDDQGGHPLFWLLLGFLCGVVATLGALLLLSSEVTGDGDASSTPPESPSAPIEIPALDGAPPPGGPIVPPPTVEAQQPIQGPLAQPTLPTPPASSATPVPPAPSPAPKAAPTVGPPRPAPPVRRSTADQIAEDAAASGMTSRTR